MCQVCQSQGKAKACWHDGLSPGLFAKRALIKSLHSEDLVDHIVSKILIRGTSRSLHLKTKLPLRIALAIFISSAPVKVVSPHSNVNARIPMLHTSLLISKFPRIASGAVYAIDPKFFLSLDCVLGSHVRILSAGVPMAPYIKSVILIDRFLGFVVPTFFPISIITVSGLKFLCEIPIVCEQDIARSTSLITRATSSSFKDYCFIMVLKSSPPLITLSIIKTRFLFLLFNNKVIAGIFINFKKFQDVWMIQPLHNVQTSLEALNGILLFQK